MSQTLIRTYAAIEECENHLTASDSFGTQVESFLTQHLLVVMCADVQLEMYRLAHQRATIAADEGIVSFVDAASVRILRSVEKGEIAKFVGYFGSESKNKLSSQIPDSEVTVYNNAVQSRHDVAHKNGSSISFSELKQAVKAAEKLLIAVADSLKVTSVAPEI